MKPRLAAAIATAAVLLLGCGNHEPQDVDTNALELKITHDLIDTYPAVRVTCPEHVRIHVGDQFECSVRGLGQATRVIDVKILDSSGRTHWVADTHL